MTQRLAAILLGATLAGCATTSPNGGGQDKDDEAYGLTSDPLEPFNRSMYAFNDVLDKALLKPVATGYERFVPGPARQIVGNFFGNIEDVWTAFNQLLQGKPGPAASDLWRFAINTTFGFGGIADVASPMGIEKHDEDFGQTLAVWGVPSGPYLVMPLFGPSTVRDGPSRLIDVEGDLLSQLDSHGLRNNLWLLRLVDTRSRLFGAERLMGGAALDEYSFVRDAWLQRRRNEIYDGDPPSPYEDDE
jgi:phospholipid-binding lipoprotein MlaA